MQAIRLILSATLIPWAVVGKHAVYVDLNKPFVLRNVGAGTVLTVLNDSLQDGARVNFGVEHISIRRFQSWVVKPDSMIATELDGRFLCSVRERRPFEGHSYWLKVFKRPRGCYRWVFQNNTLKHCDDWATFHWDESDSYKPVALNIDDVT